MQVTGGLKNGGGGKKQGENNILILGPTMDRFFFSRGTYVQIGARLTPHVYVWLFGLLFVA
jgi:hypothetical protein